MFFKNIRMIKFSEFTGMNGAGSRMFKARRNNYEEKNPGIIFSNNDGSWFAGRMWKQQHKKRDKDRGYSE